MPARRLFVALPLPEGLRERLAAVRERSSLDGARWTARDSLHVTVHFLGRVETAPEELVEALVPVAAAREPFELLLESVHAQPPRHPRMIWAEAAPSPPFAELATSIAEALAALAPDASPPRPGRPHITLARLRFGLHGQLARLDDAPAVVPVERVELMESLLGRGGARYERLAAVRLKTVA
jgi:RNA 2',3'-cyclic 3'-phosphodiesterase